MTREEMREKVGKAIYEAPSITGGRKFALSWDELRDSTKEYWRLDADAAIALVLEEAAKVAEAFPARSHGNLATAPYAAAEQAGDEIAAAIRALEETPSP